jgi:hypothetical protein
MPTTITDVNAFTDPITAPAGSDARVAASVVDPVQKLANRTRWLANLIGGASGAGEWAYPSARARTLQIAASAFASPFDTTNVVPSWDVNGSALKSFKTSAVCYFDLNHVLRSGMTITRVRAMVNPISSGLAAADRMQMAIERRTADFASPAVPSTTVEVARAGAAVNVATMADDGTGGFGVLDTGVLAAPLAVTRSSSYLIVQVTASIDGDGRPGEPNFPGDLFYALEVQFTDTGPRNY